MPPVRQRPTAAPSAKKEDKNSSLAAQYGGVPQATPKKDTQVPEGMDIGGLKLSTYGRGKTGKTRLACSFPKPMLIIGTEDGTKSICTSKKENGALADGTPIHRLYLRGKDLEIDYVRIGKGDHLLELAQLIPTAGYKSACVDHGSGLQDLLLKEQMGWTETAVQNTFGMAQREDWMAVGARWKELMRGILDLAEKHGIHIIVIAHERSFTEEGVGSDVLVPTVGSALSPTTAAWLNGAVDYIAQCFVREQTVEALAQTVEGAPPTLVRQKTGKVEYCLRIGQHPIYSTGFRVAPGIEIPDVLVIPNDPDAGFVQIAKVILGET